MLGCDLRGVVMRHPKFDVTLLGKGGHHFHEANLESNNSTCAQECLRGPCPRKSARKSSIIGDEREDHDNASFAHSRVGKLDHFDLSQLLEQ